jgi:amino acid transporter
MEATPGTTPKFFARQATGLVREAGWLDMVLFNAVGNTTLGIGFAFAMTYVLVALVGASLVWAQIVSTIFGLFVVVTWGLLSSAIPRSGGDYVLNTRVISPFWGFVGSWGLIIANFIFSGNVAIWFSQYMLGPAFASLGMVTHDQNLASLGTTLSGPGATFIIGTIFLALTGLICILGMRIAMRVQLITVIIGMIAFVTTVLSLLFIDHNTFVHNFNAVAQPYTNQPDTYNYFLQQSGKAGFTLDYSRAIEFTIVAFLSIQGFVANSFWSAYVAGEIKGVRGSRRSVGMMLVPVIVTGSLLTLAFWLLLDRGGNDFVSAVNFLSGAAPNTYALPAPPYSNMLAAIASNNPVITFIVGFGILGWGVAQSLVNYLFMSRVMFAWGFDRVLPLRLAAVSDRFHTPVVALAVAFAGAELTLIAFVYFHSSTIATFQATVFLIGQLSLILVGVSGVVFPYLKKEMYERSPAKMEFGGIPVMVICGVITTIGETGTLLIYFFYPQLGLPTFQTTAVVLAIPLVSGAVIFLGAKMIRSRQGLDLAAVYREIPPE